MIEHRNYLLYYGLESWNYGFWKAIFQNPPCKKPGSPKNKEYEFDIVIKGAEKKEIYLHLIGSSMDLDIIEKQIAKYKIARIEENQSITLIFQHDPFVNLDMFFQYCTDKGYYLGRKIIVKT